MAQQTAVNWLEEELADSLKLIILNQDFRMMEKIFEQAKQMEKEQSKQDYDSGLFDGTMDDVKDRLYKNAEQYYNETYNK